MTPSSAERGRSLSAYVLAPAAFEVPEDAEKLGASNVEEDFYDEEEIVEFRRETGDTEEEDEALQITTSHVTTTTKTIMTTLIISIAIAFLDCSKPLRIINSSSAFFSANFFNLFNSCISSDRLFNSSLINSNLFCDSRSFNNNSLNSFFCCSVNFCKD